MNLQARLPRSDTIAGCYRMATRDDEADLYFYGPVGWSWEGNGIEANRVRQDLASLPAKVKRLHVRLNSEGGDAFEGRAIYTLLSQDARRVIVHVDSLAASAASLIAMSGDEIRMADGAFMMIHEAWGVALGRAEEMRKTADLLEAMNGTMASTYAKRTNNTVAKVTDWMAEETWMTADEAKARGFADVVDDALAIAASIRDPGRFRHIPEALAGTLKQTRMEQARGRLARAITLSRR